MPDIKKGDRPGKTEQLPLSGRKGGSIKTSSKASKSVHQPLQPATVVHHFVPSSVFLLCFSNGLQQLAIRAESHRIEILPERPREEERILRDDYKLLPQLLEVEHPDVDGVDVDLARGHLRQAEEAVEQGGLSTASPSNNTHL